MELDCQDRSDEIGCCKSSFSLPLLPCYLLTRVVPICSQTDDPDPAASHDHDQLGHDHRHQLHGRRCADTRSRLASQLGPRPIQMHDDVGIGFRSLDLPRRPNHRPRRLQLRGHQRQGK